MHLRSFPSDHHCSYDAILISDPCNISTNCFLYNLHRFGSNITWFSISLPENFKLRLGGCPVSSYHFDHYRCHRNHQYTHWRHRKRQTDHETHFEAPCNLTQWFGMSSIISSAHLKQKLRERGFFVKIPTTCQVSAWKGIILVIPFYEFCSINYWYLQILPTMILSPY